MNRHLKNYTTTIPTSRSIGEIQEMLITFGASNVILDAASGRVTAVRFVFPLDGRGVPFMLPVSVDKTVDVLWREYRSSTSRGRRERQDFIEEAERVAWRIARDWVHAQISILTIEAAGFIDVFAGYLVTNMQTSETLGQRLMAGAMDRLLESHERLPER